MTTYRPDMEEAKEVHKCLKIAAGVFTYVKVSLRSIKAPQGYMMTNASYKNSAHYVVKLYFTVILVSTTIYFHLQPGES